MRRHSTAVIGVCLFVLIVSATNAGTLRRASWARVVLTQDLPEDLKSPEGRTEWDFTALATEHPWVRVVSSLEEDPSALTVVDQGLGRERLQIETRRFERVCDLRPGDDGARRTARRPAGEFVDVCNDAACGRTDDEFAADQIVEWILRVAIIDRQDC